jgi:hypothetical protein
LNNKIVSTKRTSAIFLAIVLVTGTITALSFPSFMTDVEAQPYYGEIDIRYNSYGPPEYPSYKPDYYKPQYPSYDKHDRDKSKDSSSKSVSINKIKCINTNLNINGNNTGDINLGNKGAADGGYVGGGYSSVDGSGDGYYNDGYNKNKKDNGFDCIINNNNTNINTVGGGNVTDGDGNATDGDGPDTVRTILSVSKNIGTCTPTDNSQNAIDACAAIETEILPNLYTLSITDNTLNPTLVEGSEVPVDVTVNPGDYLVAEIGTTDLQTAIADISEEFTVDIFPLFSVTGDCSLAPGDAGGTITEGDSETCNLVNSFDVRESAG